MKKKLSPISLVYLLFSVGTAAMLLSLVMSRGEFLEKIVYDFSYFVDFYDHIRRFYLNLGMVIITVRRSRQSGVARAACPD